MAKKSLCFVKFIFFFNNFFFIFIFDKAHSFCWKGLKLCKKKMCNEDIKREIEGGMRVAKKMNKKESLFIFRALEMELNQSSQLEMYDLFDGILELLLLHILVQKNIFIGCNIISIIKNKFNKNNSLLIKMKNDNKFYLIILKAYIHTLLIKENYYKRQKRINRLHRNKKKTEHDIVLNDLFSLIFDGSYNFSAIIYYLLFYIDLLLKNNPIGGLSILINYIER